MDQEKKQLHTVEYIHSLPEDKQVELIVRKIDTFDHIADVSKMVIYISIKF